MDAEWKFAEKQAMLWLHEQRLSGRNLKALAKFLINFRALCVTEDRNKLAQFMNAARSWHEMHDHGPGSVQCDLFCELAGLKLPAKDSH